MFEAVAVSGCAGWKITFVFVTLTLRSRSLYASEKVSRVLCRSTSVWAAIAVISLLQIYDGCCFHFCLGFKAAHVEQLPVGAIDDAYTLGLVDCC